MNSHPDTNVEEGEQQVLLEDSNEDKILYMVPAKLLYIISKSSFQFDKANSISSNKNISAEFAANIFDEYLIERHICHKDLQ